MSPRPNKPLRGVSTAIAKGRRAADAMKSGDQPKKAGLTKVSVPGPKQSGVISRGLPRGERKIKPPD